MMGRFLRLLAVVALLGATLSAGCVGPATLDATCGVRVLPWDIPRGAPRSGGTGDVSFQVKVLDATNASVSRSPVLAFWVGEGGRVEFVALRTNGDGLATVHAPRGATVRVLGGSEEWTGDETIVAGDPIRPRYPGADPGTLELPANVADGFFDDFWVQVPPAIGLPVGPPLVLVPDWMPNDLPWTVGERLDLLARLDLRLEWRNNSNGMLDLAIGVGRGDTWTQWNQEVQASEGLNIEELTLDRALLEENGWTTGQGLRAGPAMGEGGGYTDPTPGEKGQDWHMRWTAHFLQDPSRGDLCAAGGVSPRDVTSG